MHEAADADAQQTPEQRIASLEAQLADATRTITRLRDQYTRALEKLVLMQRRLVVTSAERRFETSTDQLELELRVTEVAALKKELDAAEKAAGVAPTDEAPSKPSATSPSAKKTDGRKKRSTAPTGRRGAELAELPKIYAPVIDPELEGKAERIGFVESYKLGHERGGPRCIVVQIAVYKKPAEVTPQATSPSPPMDTNASAGCRIVRARRPLEMIRRGMLAPSMIAYLLVQKYLMGLPFHRLEQQFARQGFSLDRGTMARNSEEIGSMLGFVVDAAREQAIATAFCLSTDATGVSIQPTPLDDGRHQPCRKGHFFVTLADRDHVFFDYQPKHDSLAVWHMFKGYKGYIQADAHVIYDAVFRGTPPDGAEETEAEAAKRAPPPIEVGCWSHARRHMWEAAVCRYPLGLEGLRRITALFDADRPLQDLPPVKRKAQRDKLLRPLVDDFFTWAKAERAKINSRSRIASALGYVLNQEGALRRFLDDGRLRLENNGAERALRTIAVGRKAWLFFGSDDHATAAGNLFSLIASCKLHGLDPETYLADVIRVFPYWPAARRLELAPKFWAKTRARLNARELELPSGTSPCRRRPRNSRARRAD